MQKALLSRPVSHYKKRRSLITSKNKGNMSRNFGSKSGFSTMSTTKKRRPQSAMDRIKNFRRDNYLKKIPKLNNNKNKSSWKHFDPIEYGDSDKKDVNYKKKLSLLINNFSL